ncbi:glycoside hydrolase family 28 protein [Caldicellulosiruptor changbaiensis]|uniref:Glycoside hydrolase family 28 protein n=1 Tax=Caldicellulosiruptor changbaiensis TaxID=1222016 RepID=A0A3T0D3Z3_9FIRM|nr:glycoside hydrolase family 28 protein [Caldicellulosiruptor changbaiensis]AZT89493.1 glycoside hydrolase family 28 protein [Caldicellulosiruptor changbaiensis]
MFLNVRDFGAVGNGQVKDTEAFKKAIEASWEQGGGTVYVPAGVYLTGPIHLKSNITLYIESGAILKFSNDPADFPLVYTRWEGEEQEVYSPLIYAENAENIAVVGFGTIDGQGEMWWKLHRNKELKYPRPRTICFYRCKNVTIEGIKIVNSPSWTVNPIECENVTVHNVKIQNPYDSPNTDGINPESCKGVRISNCYIDVGDDCVTLKSGTEDCKVRIPCENIAITNCIMAHGHGGVVIGSEMSGGVRNVVISNCIFEGTDRGIRIKTRRGRGGIVEDIRVSNIVMKNVMCPFAFYMYYHCGKGGKEKRVWDKSPYPVDESTPIVRRIYISDVIVRQARAAAGFLYGLTEMPIEDVMFSNVTVEMAQNPEPELPAMMSYLEPMAKKGFVINTVKNIRFMNVTVLEQEGVAFELNNCENVEFYRCRAKDTADYAKILSLNNTMNLIAE